MADIDNDFMMGQFDAVISKEVCSHNWKQMMMKQLAFAPILAL